MAKYNINLGFEIDMNKMDKALKDITARINELNKKGTLNGLVISEADKAKYLTEMTKLRDAVAKEFEKRKYGTDPKVKMGAESEDVRKAAESLNNYNKSLGNNSVMAQRAINTQTKMAEEFKKTKEQLTPMQKAVHKLTGAFQSLAMFSVAQFGFSNITGIFTEAVEHTKALDKVLTDIRINTGATTEQLKQYTIEYNKMAVEMGKTTAEIGEATAYFYRQGLRGIDALKMTEVSTVGAAISRMEVDETADKLTSIIKGYQMSSNEAMSAMDKIAVLDSNMATSAKEVFYAMTKISSAAHNANMTLEDTLSLVGTISEVTREAPENIGFLRESESQNYSLNKIS